jgi:hypothetical protein
LGRLDAEARPATQLSDRRIHDAPGDNSLGSDDPSDLVVREAEHTRRRQRRALTEWKDHQPLQRERATANDGVAEIDPLAARGHGLVNDAKRLGSVAAPSKLCASGEIFDPMAFRRLERHSQEQARESLERRTGVWPTGVRDPTKRIKQTERSAVHPSPLEKTFGLTLRSAPLDARAVAGEVWSR